MLLTMGVVPEALLHQPRFTWLVSGHRRAGHMGARLHFADEAPLTPGTSLANASLEDAKPGTAPQNIVFDLHSAGWIGGDTMEASAGLVGRPNPTDPRRMQLAVVRGLGHDGNLAVLLARFLQDQIASGCVRLWLLGVRAGLAQAQAQQQGLAAQAQQQGLAAQAQQQGLAAQLKDAAKHAMAGLAGVCGLAATFLPARQQKKPVLFDDMLEVIFEQQAGPEQQQPHQQEAQQQQQAAGDPGQQQQQQPDEGEAIDAAQQALLAGWYEAAHPGKAPAEKAAFYQCLVEGVDSFGVLTLLGRLETAQDVVLEAASEQQGQAKGHGLDSKMAAVLQLAGRQPASCSDDAVASPAVIQQLIASQQVLQQYHQQQVAAIEKKLQEVEQKQEQQQLSQQQACQLQQQKVDLQEKRTHHKRELTEANKQLTSLEVAAAASAAGAPAPAGAAAPGLAGGASHQQQANQQQQGDSSSMWVFGGLAAPVSAAVAEQLRSREAIAAALRQPPEALDPRYRWLQRVLCAYLQSACLPREDWGAAGSSYSPLVRWLLQGKQGLQLVPQGQVNEVVYYVRWWAQESAAKVKCLDLDQLQDTTPQAAAQGRSCPSKPWQRRPAAPRGPLLPYGWYEGGWIEKRLFWAQRFDHIVLCSYGAMMASAVGQVAEQCSRTVRAQEWLVPKKAKTPPLTADEQAFQQLMQQQMQQVQQRAQQRRQQLVAEQQQQQHAGAAAADAEAMELDSDDEQQAGGLGMELQAPQGDATADVHMVDVGAPDPAAAPQQQQQLRLPSSYAAALHQHCPPQRQAGCKRAAEEQEPDAAAPSGSQPPMPPAGHFIHPDLQDPLKWEQVLQKLGCEAADKAGGRITVIRNFCNQRLAIQPPAAAGPSAAEGQPEVEIAVSAHADQWGSGQQLMLLWSRRTRKQQKGSSTCVVRLLPAAGQDRPTLSAEYLTDATREALRAQGCYLTGWHDQVPSVPLDQLHRVQLLVEVSGTEPQEGQEPTPPEMNALLLGAAAGLHVLYGQVKLPEELQVQLELHPPTRVDLQVHTVPCKPSPPEVDAVADLMGAPAKR
jgi:hypothetical protein